MPHRLTETAKQIYINSIKIKKLTIKFTHSIEAQRSYVGKKRLHKTMFELIELINGQ